MNVILLTLGLLLLLWIAVGIALVYSGARPRGTVYRRSISSRHGSVGEPLAVQLQLQSPIQATKVAPHDIVLVLDHSASMGSAPGSPLWSAKREAANFVRRLPPHVAVGLVSFDHQAATLSALTTDHARVQQAIEAIGPGGNTDISAALQCTRQVLEDSGRADVDKVIILFSDGDSEHSSAIKVSEELHHHPTSPRIVCAGFGPTVDQELLEAIAGSEGFYVYIAHAKDIDRLFHCLSRIVGGGAALWGDIDEVVMTADNFQLAQTGGFSAKQVRENDLHARLAWTVPLLNNEAVALDYELVMLRPGWHCIASSDSRAIWQMPDGQRHDDKGPVGPWVLVLPAWLDWAWWLFNPLFWLLFGLLFKRPVPTRHPLPAAVKPPPLPSSSLPELSPPPQEPGYQPASRPTLIVGLGKYGERILSELKYLLLDRGLSTEIVKLLALRMDDPINRPSVAAQTPLQPDERIDLHCDLRPYLESLCHNPVQPSRRWIPYREWLAQTRPLHTLFGVGNDRRLARLVLLQSAAAVDTRLAGILADLKTHSGATRPVALVLAATAEPEATGSFMEIAHILAHQGIGVTGILAPPGGDNVDLAGMLGFAEELERLLQLPGLPVPSDRCSPPAIAKRIFDHLIVLQNPENSLDATGLIWNLVNNQSLFDRLSGVGPYQVQTYFQSLPDLATWHWARYRALQEVLVNGWLAISTDGRPAPLAESQVHTVVQDFFSGQGQTRPRGQVIEQLGVVYTQRKPAASVILGAANLFPVQQPEHVQVAFCEHERSLRQGYLAEWVQNVLNQKRADRRWCMTLLLGAVKEIGHTLDTFLQEAGELGRDRPSAQVSIEFVSRLVRELRVEIERLSLDAAGWVTCFVGQVPGLVDISRDDRKPLAEVISIRAATASEAQDKLSDTVRAKLESAFRSWKQQYAEYLPDVLRFEWISDGAGRPRLGLRLGSQLLTKCALVDQALYDFLEKYRDAMRHWPTADCFQPQRLRSTEMTYRFGRFSNSVYPDITEVLDDRDTFTVAVVHIDQSELSLALGLQPRPRVSPVFAYPEEANAAIIASSIRYRLQQQPADFSPLARAVLSDTEATWAFFKELADGTIAFDGYTCYLKKEGGFNLGPVQGGLQPLAIFETVLRQVVIDQVSIDGKPLPLSLVDWRVDPYQAADAVEATELGQLAKGDPRWAMWRHVVWGLALVHGESID